MKTLIVVSHPEIDNSGSQQYLKKSLPDNKNITWHHLESLYSKKAIDREKERQLLAAHDRIILQFPFYWYSAPAKLKQWLDEVLLTDDSLRGKELGLVLVIGSAAKDYQVGGQVDFDLSTLTSPYQAIAKKLQMNFLKLFPIFQFHYMDESERMQLLISYQQYLTLSDFDSLRAKEQWFLSNLAKTEDALLMQVKEQLLDNRSDLDELELYLKGK
ncbi:MAG TPA: NAD(P)H-dependent oxidoreductase [Tetragenococcus sp.]|nr:NAD(P)H-dependent oxidoreductase [Tetragenococcus sp.]